MIYRIFMTLVILTCLWFTYDTARIQYAKIEANRADDAYIQTSDAADITVTEFLDYSCGSCQGLHPILMRALEQDGRVRFIPKPVTPPDGNETGLLAGKLALAAGRQGKFFEAHDLLMTNYRSIDEAFIQNFAATLQLDTAQLQQDVEDPEIQLMLDRNNRTARALKAQFIPALLIENRVLYEMTLNNLPSTQDLLDVFNRARQL